MIKRSWIAIAAVGLCGAGGLWWAVERADRAYAADADGGAKPADSGTPVTAGTVETKDVPVYVRGLGTVQAFNAVTVKSRADGQITQVLFTEGQDVKAGDRLFEIDPRPYQATLDQATAAKAKDEAALHSAQLDLDRYSALVGKGFQTRQSYDEQKATVEQDLATVNSDQALIESAKLNLAYTDIRAPIDGRTGARLVDMGNIVQASAATPLVTITQIKPIFVSFTVPQDSLDVIRKNAAAQPLEADAYGADDTVKLSTGKLTLVDNQIDTTTGTIHLKATFPNADERLWPGQFVNSRLVLSVRKNALTVPAQTVMRGAAGEYVFVIQPDSTVQKRDVTTAATQDGIAVIEKGLTAGEKVVVEGQYRLTNGGKVNTNPPKQQQSPAAG